MTKGIHHVTAIAGPARRNLSFYTDVLGQRLVKKTVNFDDPGTYHFYFGDAAGNPGTILTFFPWEHAAPGRLGTGETSETAYRVPETALGFWLQRFVEKGVPHEDITTRFGERVLTFRDPDGMRLALVGVPGIESEAAWTTPEIPAEVALRGFHGVTLLIHSIGATAAILTDVLGFHEVAKEGAQTRFGSEAGIGGFVTLHEAGGFPRGAQGAGSVHHVAFRASSDAEQAEMVKKLTETHGMHVTGQRDRNYFRSVYFREPGGVLFEIATDDPGFAVDEPFETLGEALKLPAQYEKHRERIEEVLPDLTNA